MPKLVASPVLPSPGEEGTVSRMTQAASACHGTYHTCSRSSWSHCRRQLDGFWSAGSVDAQHSRLQHGDCHIHDVAASTQHRHLALAQFRDVVLTAIVRLAREDDRAQRQWGKIESGRELHVVVEDVSCCAVALLESCIDVVAVFARVWVAVVVFMWLDAPVDLYNIPETDTARWIAGMIFKNVVV